MQARIKSPVLTVPGAFDAFKRLGDAASSFGIWCRRPRRRPSGRGDNLGGDSLAPSHGSSIAACDRVAHRSVSRSCRDRGAHRSVPPSWRRIACSAVGEPGQ
jgi:hypothetical protein